MSSKVLSLEVSERLIKACVVNEKQTVTNKIYDAFVFQTPEGVISDGQINDTDRLAEVIRAEIAIHEIKKVKGIVFSLQSGKIAAREVKLPLIRENKIKSVVETNASEYFPVDMSKYHITYSILEKIEEQPEPGLRIMVYAAPMAILDNYFRVAELLGMTIVSIDYCGNSLFNLVKPLFDEKVTLHACIDTTAACVVVTQNHTLMLQRYFPCGCDELTAIYMQARGIEDENFFKTMTDLINDKLEDPPSEAEIADGCTRITSNIERIVDYYNSGHSDAPIDRIVITGPCCRIHGLVEHISGSIALPTEKCDTIPGFPAASTVTDFPAIYLANAGCIIAPLDLIPPQYAKKKKQRNPNSLVVPIVFLITAFLVGGALSGWAIFDYLSAKSDLEALNDRISDLEYAEKIYLRFNDYSNSAAGFNALSEFTASNNSNLVAFIEELEKKMPSEISVLSASCYEDGVNLNVVVTSKEAAAKVISQLRTFKSLETVSVSAITESAANDLGIKQVFFSINCTYGENPYYPDDQTN